MDEKQTNIAMKLFTTLLNRFPNQRAFSRAIDEDCADIYLWKTGRKRIRPRAVVTMARLFGADPHMLRPDIFQDDVKLVFLTKE